MTALNFINWLHLLMSFVGGACFFGVLALTLFCRRAMWGCGVVRSLCLLGVMPIFEKFLVKLIVMLREDISFLGNPAVGVIFSLLLLLGYVFCVAMLLRDCLDVVLPRPRSDQPDNC